MGNSYAVIAAPRPSPVSARAAFRVQGLGLMIKGQGVRVHGLRFKV
jgi:hypothetical protein